MMGFKAAEDPVERYKSVVAFTQPRPELSAEALEGVIARSGGPEEAVAAVSRHVAQYGRLSAPEAQATVEAAVRGVQGSGAQAAAVSAALAATPTGEVQLSDPVMLNPWARLVFAALLNGAVGGCIWQIAVLGEAERQQESAIVCLAVVAVLSLLGVLVLAMGYKNVTIKGGAAG